MTYECTLVDVALAMSEQPVETQVEYRIDRLVSDIDELIAMAHDPETASAIAAQEKGIGQILTRAQLLVSFLIARQEPKLKVIRNG